MKLMDTISQTTASLPQMNTDGHELDRINQITEKIIGAAFKVANTLGIGFLEKVYENSLSHELRKAGLHVEQQKSIDVLYDGVVVGLYIADLIVEDIVPVELKSAKSLDDTHLAQCINHLRATGYPIELLINFGTPKLEIKRIANPLLKLPKL
jgi:GxxExxY protein